MTRVSGLCPQWFDPQLPTYEIAPERFTVVEDRLAARRQLREARLDRFDHYVTELEGKE